MHATGKILLTEAEAAALIGFSRRFLQRRRYEGTGPEYVRMSNAVRYLPEDVERWAETFRIKSGRLSANA